MKKQYALLIIAFLITFTIRAQTGTEFWFAVPEVSWQHNNAGGEPTILRVTSLDLPVTITLSMPKANQTLFPPIIRNLAANSTSNIDLTPWIRTGAGVSGIPPLVHGTANDNNIIESGLYTEYGVKKPKGMLLEASGGDVTAYLERNNANNKDIFALKAKNALGTDFWLPGQNFYQNHSYTTNPATLSGYDIVATEDNTIVTIKLPAGKTANRIGWTTAGGTYTVMLDRGEAFSIVADSRSVADHLQGTRITANADHPISIMWKDDSIDNNTTNGWDLCGDQLVPNNLAGKTYVVMRGNLGTNLTATQKCSEFAFITTVKPNTRVKYIFWDNINAKLDSITTANIPSAGTMVRMQLNEFYENAAKPLIDALYIEATDSVLVSQISGSGFEMGGAVIPRIDGCTGSLSVTINRSSPDSCYLNIMTKAAHINDFYIKIAGTEYHIPSTWFALVPGMTNRTTQWYYLTKTYNNFSSPHGGIPAIPPNASTTVRNASGFFHLGMLNGNYGGGGKYGYFSNFSEDYGSAFIETSASDYIKYCYKDTIRLQASGGVTYVWENASTPFVDNTFVDSKTIYSTRVKPPPGFHTYKVDISRACYKGGMNPDTSMYVQAYGYPEIIADFDTTQIGPDCCSPYYMKYINKSSGANKYEWTFERVEDTLTNIILNPEVVYFANKNYVQKNVKTRLKVSYSNNCPDTISATIPIKPEITAKGSTGSKSGCQQDVTQTFFADTVLAGPITSVYWNWGEGSETEVEETDLGTLGTNPFPFTHTFTNLKNTDTAYVVMLVFIDSVHDCRDTMLIDTVFVPGVARARFTIDKDKGCSPLQINFDNVSNGSVTYEWDFGDGNIRTSGNDTLVTYTNITAAPINRYISLTITKANADGTFCYDTYLDTITVYPQFNTVISPAGPLAGCNPLTIDFSQTTTPNVPNLLYAWNFGDGSTSGVSDPAPKVFSHLIGSNQNYQVSLITTSEYNCKSTAIPVDVTVYAYVDASFTVSPDTAGCSPLTIVVANNTAASSVKNFVWSIPDNIGSPPNNSTPFNVVYQNITGVNQIKTITLANSNANGCSRSYSKQITVFPEITPRFSKSNGTNTICNNAVVTFTNTSFFTGTAIPITSTTLPKPIFFWEFGDGTTSAAESPLKSFNNTTAAVKAFPIKLTLTLNGCSKVYLDTVRVYQQVLAQMNTAQTILCAPQTIAINNTSLGATQYLWQFSDGSANQNTVNLSPINFLVTNPKPNDTINIHVYLTASNSNCSDRDTLTLQVYPAVLPQFIADVNSGCGPLNVVFTNQTQGGNSTNNKLTYLWDFNDGTNSNSTNATVAHQFSNRSAVDKTYTISLTATNTAGCNSTVTRTITVFPEVEAIFTFQKSTECTPMPVFLDNSSFNGTQYRWDMGFAGKDTIAAGDFFYQFYHTNANPNAKDIYNIELVAYDANHPQCSDSVTRAITIFPPVVANYSVSNNSIGCSPLNTEFTNSSTGYKLTYIWDYDDQNTSGNNQVVHNHSFENLSASNKTYNVKLTAIDTNGCVATTFRPVVAYPKVVADFAYVKDAVEKCTPYPVHFSYPSSAINGNKFIWNFGFGGNTATYNAPRSNFSFNFDNALPNTINNYTITLIARDTVTGCADTITRPIEVYPRLVPGFVTMDGVYEGCNPFTAQFVNNTTGLASYAWDFKDEQTSPETNPQHTFSHFKNSDQTYDVLLTATQTGTGCVKTANHDVTSYSYINPKFGLRQASSKGINADPILGGCSPFNVMVTDSSTTNGTWRWDFGDGTTQNDVTNPPIRNLTYTNNDNVEPLVNAPYTISLIVENLRGCTKTTSQTLEVYPRSVPDFNVPLTGCHPFSVNFVNTSVDDNNSQYYWRLGDGATAVDAELAHTYFNNSYFDNQTFNVTLISTTSFLCSDSITKQITVYPKPLAVIKPIIDRGCSPLTTQLENVSKGTKPYFYWDFDDGNTKETALVTTEMPQYSNLTTAVVIKVVELMIESEYGCTDTVEQLINVYPEATAAFTYFDPSDTAGCSPHLVEFKNTSTTTATVFRWNFGSGTTSQLKEPTYRYVNDGTDDHLYTVTLDVETPYGCKGQFTDEIMVYLSPNAEFLVDDPVKLYPDTIITFQNTVKPGPWSFEWTYGDGQGSTNANEFHNHSYTGWGPPDNDFVYTVWLKAFSNHCRDSIWQFVTINAPLPEINIQQRNPLGCVPLGVDFHVSYAYGYRDSILWKFGDGTTAREPEPYHIYANAGVYIAQVSIVGDGGKYVDTTKVYAYAIPKPSFEFSPDFVMLPNQPVQFFNTSYLIDDHTFEWNFGDDTKSTEVNPWHQYTYENLSGFYVTLTATSIYGCDSVFVADVPVIVSGEGSVEFPNAFLPNSSSPSDGSYPTPDTENNVFHPIHRGVKNYELWIFNRWGEQLFYSDNIEVGWNGRYANDGKNLGQDVYFWKCQGEFNNGVPFEQTGDCTLIRR